MLAVCTIGVVQAHEIYASFMSPLGFRGEK
ncbi:hypothetical protein SBDP1_1160021 [Syntrophobacter sp. SbD1]|nr:hypothetical protein SBDP1_1160021 [Syntrophobacter sp. SbD1]